METQWEPLEASTETAKYLRGTHRIWSRILANEQIFAVLPLDCVPQPGDGGYIYFSIAAALKTNGMMN